jgi:hypothetical protein
MPNHLHGILILTHNGGAGEAQLGEIVGEFKSIGTGAYIRGVRQRGWPAFDGQLWQRNYYEHVIRDDESLRRIREYIRWNPARWDADPENGGGGDSESSARRGPTRGAPTGAIDGNVGITEARIIS